MKLKVICVTYNQDYELKCLINSFKCQTNQNYELIILHDGKNSDLYASLMRNNYLSEKIKFDDSYGRFNDWGHSLREIGIKNFVTEEDDFVLITNGDNYYCPKFVEYVLRIAEQFKEGHTTQSYDYYPPVGIIYFNMIHSHFRGDSSSGTDYGYFNTDFKHSMCDIGAFIARRDIIQSVGFRDRGHDADGVMINDILEYQKTHDFSIMKISQVLFVHN